MERFGKAKSEWGYIFISGMFFGLVHWWSSLAKTVATFIFGLIAARLYVWTKSLLPLIVAHIISDLEFL
jgi:membrane protease YdiL (CAAX protease family)